MTSTSQLTLNLTPRLAYSAKNFIWHKGVSDLSSQILALQESSPARFVYINAEARSGKTHFSIAISDLLIARGMKPVLLDGEEFKKIVLAEKIKFYEKETLVVDDCQLLFESILPEQSGPVVRFFEALRVNQIGLVLLSSKNINEFPCDQHVISRLKGCVQMQINQPDFESVPKLVDSMAKQRGLSLGSRRLRFLEKRVSRSIPDIEDYLCRLACLSEIIGKRVNFSTLGDALKPIKAMLF